MPAHTIRFAHPDDAGRIAALYAASVTDSVVSFEFTAPTPAQIRQRIATVQARAPWLVCVSGNALLGYAYLSRHRERAAYHWCVDSSIFVDREHHRRGIGRALYTALFALATLQGYHAVHAGITLPNPASVALHEALGFRLVGVYPSVGYKLGAWHDVGWWQLELRERLTEPAPLRTPEQARAEHPAEWAAALESPGHEGSSR